MWYKFPVKALHLLIFFSGAYAPLALGSQAQNFGLDAKSTGRAGSVTAEEKNAHSALYNPALLGAQTQSGFSFSTSQVEVKITELGNRDTLPSQSQTRWALGFNRPIHLKTLSRQAGFGLSFSGPFEKIRGFVAHAPDDSFTARYGTADGQFKGTASLGLELIPNTLFFGTGLSLFLSGAGVAETTISSNPTSRMNLDVVLEKAPVFGLYARSDSFSSALTYHQKIDPILEQEVRAKVEINKRDTFEQPVLMRSSLYFEPQTLEWDLQQRESALSWSVGLSYQFWKDYQAPVLFTETPDLIGNTHRTNGGNPPTRNTLNPRASLGMRLGTQTFASMGYQFRPTPFFDLSGTSNALDADTHILGMALEQHFSDSWILGTPLSLGFFGQVHRLNNREIFKTPQNGGASSAYTLNGNAWIVGVSAQAEL